MKNSYDIFIDLNDSVKFPKKCVLCGKECKDKSNIRANPDGFWGFHKWLLGMTKNFTVYCHTDCSRGLKSSLFSRNLLLLSLALITAGFALYFDISKWIAIIISVPFIVYLISWQIHNPPPFEVVRDDDKVQFTFSDKTYAEEFAALNNTIIDKEEDN